MHLVWMMRPRNGFFAEIDDLVVARARRRDIDALETLYRAFSGPVHTLAWRLCRSKEEAEDVLQETFLEITRSIRSFRGEGAIGAWIHRVAVSKALTSLRRRKRGPEGSTVESDPERSIRSVQTQDPDGGWHRVDLERALGRLPDASRAVVWLHDVEGFTHAEIAELFGRSPSFSKSQLSRAHARLRAWLGRRGGTHDASESGRVAGAARR
jgi:RNA polymerase sigma-70 factor (ECF subfamily)